jgi:cytochrome P450
VNGEATNAISDGGDVVSRVDTIRTAFRTHQFDSEILRRDGLDPLPQMSRVSLKTPLIELAGPLAPAWLATGRDEVRTILGDPKRFSSHPPADSEEESIQQIAAGNLLQYDPPEHTRLRRMLAPEFTVQKMRRLAPLVENIVAERLDLLEAVGPPADLIRHFAWPVAALVSCALIGIPCDDRYMLAHNLNITSDGRRSGKQAASAAKAYEDYMRRLVSQKRLDPGQDLLSRLIRKYGSKISDKELAGIGSNFVRSGLDNIGGMLGLGTLALLEHPEQLTLIRNRPEVIDQAVEELIRYISIVPIVSPRTAVEDVSLAGKVIKAREVVICSVLAVNRTQTPGGLGDGLDVTREINSHMAFGHGNHYCIGAALTRVELQIAYLALLHRFSDLRLAVPRDELRFRSYAGNYNVETLPVTW